MANPVEIKGMWYPAGSSRRQVATLRGEGARYQVTAADGKTVSGSLTDVEISKRVGNIPRNLKLADQSLFETADNASVDSWLGQSSAISGSGLLHHMETRWSWIVLSLLAVVLFVYAGGRYGVPWISDKTAQLMPQKVVNYISDGSLDLLDRLFLKPSELDHSRRDAISTRFNAEYGEGYTLHFRHLGMPNAFALPGGDIVITDSFVKLATTSEFDAVVLHEIGHIQLRHGMQLLVQSSIVSFVVAMVLGDPSGIEEAVIALPVFLMQSHYSREYESAADDFALREMMARGIDPIHFATIMKKLENTESRSEKSEGVKSDSKQSPVDFLSSHPSGQERIDKAEKLSLEFRQRSQGDFESGPGAGS